MMEEVADKDIAKELLTALSYCDYSVLSKLPNEVLTNLSNIAADSNKDYYFDKTKSLIDQSISEECKDLLSILYYTFIADSSSKPDIIKAWLNNEQVE